MPPANATLGTLLSTKGTYVSAYLIFEHVRDANQPLAQASWQLTRSGYEIAAFASMALRIDGMKAVQVTVCGPLIYSSMSLIYMNGALI